ncbi:DMT family transporter [Brevibacillus composti]|uniref:DMT family transporter n=1 Tax=Brevibacillus composti TaxID=2796470 RepID=A0A7T5JNW4_9BACL|nr:DMT family transporter [Brevibacillus composti]QQE74522.1 DMT family transporter [Brevibacillus composti]QUO41604.1 DMT family transporter [Brevibacillus composti]
MRYLLLVFLGACSYGILSTIVKLAYGQGYSPGEVVGGQMFFGFLLTWLPALFVLRQRPSLKRMLLLLAVGLPVGSTGLLYYNSLQHIPASIAIVLLFQFTWMSVLLETLLTRKRPAAITLYSLILLFAGTILAGGILDKGIGNFSFAGIAFGLSSAVSYTLFIFFSGKAAPEVNSWLRTSLMSTGSMLLVFLIYPPSFLVSGVLWDGLFGYVFLLAAFGVFVPTVCFNFGVPHTGPGMAGILGAAELPMAVFSSYIILQESVSLLQWLGVIIILLGIILPEWVRFRGTKTTKTPSPLS